MCQATRAGGLPTSTRQPSAPTQVRVPAQPVPGVKAQGSLVKERQLFLLRGASFPAFVKATREWRPLGVHNKEQSGNIKRSLRKAELPDTFR